MFDHKHFCSERLWRLVFCETDRLLQHNGAAVVFLVDDMNRRARYRAAAGNDRLVQLGDVDNSFNTGAGDDTVNTGLGYDFAYGEEGNDLLIVDYSVNEKTANHQEHGEHQECTKLSFGFSW